jgi:hypothetical protein
MSTKMRAKFAISRIEQFVGGEKLYFNAVSAKSYPADGSDEDNTYAKYSPSAECSIHIVNPALLGQFKPGEKYYVDFTPAPAE